MKYVSVALNPSPEKRHPMHAFVIAHDGYEMSRLLEMNLLEDGHWTSLFHVVGSPLEPYRAALEAAGTVLDYAISERPDDSFFLYVRSSPSDLDQGLISAARQRGLVTVGPVEFRSDGTIRLTMVAPGEAVQQALDEMPADIGVEVLSIGEYHARHIGTGSDLTERQYEAVTAAVDAGYYEEPRTGSVADVAEALDCASGTAAELLRRAEASVMADIVSREPGSIE